LAFVSWPWLGDARDEINQHKLTRHILESVDATQFREWLLRC